MHPLDSLQECSQLGKRSNVFYFSPISNTASNKLHQLAAFNFRSALSAKFNFRSFLAHFRRTGADLCGGMLVQLPRDSADTRLISKAASRLKSTTVANVDILAKLVEW